MAVAYDAQSESHTGTTGDTSSASFSWTHTPSGTPHGALVFVYSIGDLTDTGVTYGGTAMTAVPYTGTATDTEPGAIRAYYLDNVASGAQSVVVSRTNNAVQMYAVCFTVTAASATEVYLPGVKTRGGSASNTAASSSGTGTQSPVSQTIDDGSPGTGSIRFLGEYYGGSSVLSARTAATSLGPSIDFGLFVAMSFYETSASQGATDIGPTSVTADDLASIGLAIRESVAANVTATPGVVALVLTTFAPTVTASDHKLVTPGVLALTLATFAPTVTALSGTTAVPGILGLVLSTFAPVVTATAHQTVTPGVLSLVLSTFAPVVTGGAGATASPGTIALTLSTFSPTVTASDQKTATPGVVALTLTAFAPTVTASDSKVSTPGVVALVLSTFVPTISVTLNKTATPTTLSLTLNAFVPTITVSIQTTSALMGLAAGDSTAVLFSKTRYYARRSVSGNANYEDIWGDLPRLETRVI